MCLFFLKPYNVLGGKCTRHSPMWLHGIISKTLLGWLYIISDTMIKPTEQMVYFIIVLTCPQIHSAVQKPAGLIFGKFRGKYKKPKCRFHCFLSQAPLSWGWSRAGRQSDFRYIQPISWFHMRTPNTAFDARESCSGQTRLVLTKTLVTPQHADRADWREPYCNRDTCLNQFKRRGRYCNAELRPLRSYELFVQGITRNLAECTRIIEV